MRTRYDQWPSPGTERTARSRVFVGYVAVMLRLVRGAGGARGSFFVTDGQHPFKMDVGADLKHTVAKISSSGYIGYL